MQIEENFRGNDMEDNRRLNKSDKIVIVIITLIYAIISFINLGNTSAPMTQPDMGDGEKREYITYVTLDREEEIDSLLLYKGLGRCGISVYKADEDGKKWKEIEKKVCEKVYTWEKIELSEKAQKLCISIGGDASLEVFEAGFKRKDGTTIYAIADGCMLFDEQELVPEFPSYKNGTYFDEIYHARTAYENVEGIYPYEISHPPLGKLIISAGISIFGMNPFGWRIAGNIFGILMIPLMYIFAKRIFKSSKWAVVASLLLTFDFMHFTQTRIATIDSFSVFFIMLMYYLMYIYYDSSVKELSFRKSLYILALCGVVFGLGIATKWICVYAGLGLAVLFVLSAIKRYKEGENPLKTCLWCVLFFIVIPFGIYFLSYMPYFATDGDASTFKTFWDNQVYMLTYHGGLESTHAFQSKWFTWPAVIRPIWYFGSKELAAQGGCSTIVAFGNPAVWWTGSICMLCLFSKFKKSRGEWFVICGFLSQYLPWVFIGRSTFIYHFFASVPFIILSLTFILKWLDERFKWGKYVAVAVMVCAGILFVMFFPVLGGMECDRNYVLNVLSWFKYWKLCY